MNTLFWPPSLFAHVCTYSYDIYVFGQCTEAGLIQVLCRMARVMEASVTLQDFFCHQCCNVCVAVLYKDSSSSGELGHSSKDRRGLVLVEHGENEGLHVDVVLLELFA